MDARSDAPPFPYQLIALQDEFDGVIPSWELVAIGECSAMEIGSLRLTLTQASSECTYRSVSAYDFRDKAVVVEATPSAAPDARARLGLYLDAANYVALAKIGNDLVAVARVTGTAIDVPRAYSATAHRWWLMRFEGTFAHWMTSADGRVFETVFSADASVFGTTMFKVDLGHVAGIGATGLPATAEFDHLNSPQ